jgi:hypothetical protein
MGADEEGAHVLFSSWTGAKLWLAQPAFDEIVENGAPRLAGLATAVFGGLQHFLAVLAHAEHDQEHDRGGLPVEPDPHHGAIQKSTPLSMRSNQPSRLPFCGILGGCTRSCGVDREQLTRVLKVRIQSAPAKSRANSGTDVEAVRLSQVNSPPPGIPLPLVLHQGPIQRRLV